MKYNKSYLVFISSVLLLLSGCANDNNIEKWMILDVSSGLFPDFNSPIFNVFDDYDVFIEYFYSFDYDEGSNLEKQKSEIKEWLSNSENNYIFLVIGTFGSSDEFTFSYKSNELVCDIYIPDPSTEGLETEFFAIFIYDDTDFSIIKFTMFRSNYEGEFYSTYFHFNN